MRSYLLAALVLLLLGLAVAVPLGLARRAEALRARNEQAAQDGLWLLTTAMEAYRKLDYDGSKGLNWWRGDIRSLHDLVPEGGTEPIRLIPREMALAEPGRPDSRPWNGYWFVPLDPGEGYAFCAYPAEYRGTGTRTYGIDHRGRTADVDWGSRPPGAADELPFEEILRSYYTRGLD